MPLFLDIEKKLPGFTLSMQLETGDETTALLGASGSAPSTWEHTYSSFTQTIIFTLHVFAR